MVNTSQSQLQLQSAILTTFIFHSKSTPNKDELCRELHTMLRGGDNYQKLVMAHDAARIVQCMLKHSPADIRREISEVRIGIHCNWLSDHFYNANFVRLIFHDRVWFRWSVKWSSQNIRIFVYRE